MDLTKVDDIIDSYSGDDSWLIMILQDVQDHFNYLPADALKHVAEKLDVSLAKVFNVATFYSSFSLTERGKHLIKLCDGTACHLRGATTLGDEVTRQLGIEAGETTEDKMFTLDTVACLGACALAPVLAIGSKYHGKMTPQKLKATLEYHRQERGVAANA